MCSQVVADQVVPARRMVREEPLRALDDAIRRIGQRMPTRCLKATVVYDDAG